MKRVISIVLIIISLLSVAVPAFAKEVDPVPFYAPVKTSTARVYAQPDFDAETRTIARGTYLICDFEPGVNVFWVRVRQSMSSNNVGYMPIESLDMTMEALCGAYFGTGSMSQGDTGNAVGWLRAFLKQLGYNITVGTSYTSATKSAVEAFQRDHDMGVDGIVGPSTKRALIMSFGRFEQYFGQ